MLEQARREIDLQVRLAQRTLRRRAGELAVSLATDRVRRAINEADQARLVDRYLAQVQPRAGNPTEGLPS
jgi:F0F1-type ATP synthase membrane subunit b/b'